MDVRREATRMLAVRNSADRLVVCRTAVRGRDDDRHAGQPAQLFESVNQARLYLRAATAVACQL